MKIGKWHSVRSMQGVSSFSLGFYPNLKLALGLKRAFLLSFIGHNFGDYKNRGVHYEIIAYVLSVTILETTKTSLKVWYWVCKFYRSQFWRLQKLIGLSIYFPEMFYRSQFWRLQKQQLQVIELLAGFIGHNFGDYKNLKCYQLITP